MTRQEFVDTVDNMNDLYNFCSENDLYDLTEGYYDDYMLDDMLNEYIQTIDQSRTWTEIRDYLDSIPQGCSWYHEDYYTGEIHGVDDDDVDDLKERVLDYCDENDFEWDEEILDPEEEEINACQPEEGTEEICFDDFLEANEQMLATISEISKSK